MTQPEKPLNVLLVEDEWLIAMDLAMVIEEQGHVVVGPAQNVRTAMELIKVSRIDAAFLDINLGSEMSFPIAQALDDKGVPVTFVSAYARKNLREEFCAFDLLPKPVDLHLFEQQLCKMLAAA